MMDRYMYCKQCMRVSEAYFPTGYRGAGIDACPECGSRNIDIELREA